MRPADIAQGIAKDAQENSDGLDVVNLPTYGGSAPWYVGQTTGGLLQGVIRHQMYLEDSVAHDPEPDIMINWQPNGDYTAQIQYSSADTGETMPALVVEVTE
jgi:hypothetical protein